MRVLWLPSYYPNPYQKDNNIFIKNAAKALSKLVPVDVIHVVQLGCDKLAKKGAIHDKDDNFREMIYSFDFKPFGVKFIDAFLYNIKYNNLYNKLLNNYIKQYGKPDIIHVHEPLLAGLVVKKMMVVWEAQYYISIYKQNFNNNQYLDKQLHRKVTAVLKKAKKVFTDDEVTAKNIESFFGKKGVKPIITNPQYEEAGAQSYYDLYKYVEKNDDFQSIG